MKTWAHAVLICIILTGCLGGVIRLPDGTEVRQSSQANTPATLTTADGVTISTGADLPQTATEIRESARAKLVWIGAACIVAGIAIATWGGYPTPGIGVGAAGACLLLAQAYPWALWVCAGLVVMSGGVYFAHEVGLQKPSPK